MKYIEQPDASFRPSLLPLLLLSAQLTALCGCAGTIDDPETFYRATEGQDLSDASDGGVDHDGPTSPSLVQIRCFGCHGMQVTGGLDMASDGLADRLVGKEASTCPGEVLVEPGSTDGFMIDKLGPNPACGAPMPLGATPLTDDEVQQIRAWLAQQLGLPLEAATGGARAGEAAR